MKKVTQTIGIDVSKLTLDLYVRTTNVHKQFTNDLKGFKQIISWATKQKINLEETLFCFEHTGWYCLMLSYFLYENNHRYCCVNAIEIKRSMGLKRGKSDKADAWEIANYAWLRRDELTPSIPPAKKLIELQRMMSLREQLVKQLTASKNLYKGMQEIVIDEKDVSLSILQENINHLEKQILTTEKAMNELIKLDETMVTNYKLSKTVKGVGMVLLFKCYCTRTIIPVLRVQDSFLLIADWYLIHISQERV